MPARLRLFEVEFSCLGSAVPAEPSPQISGWPCVRPAGCALTLPKTLRLRAFAKINAGLKILCQRPDGYHEIRTIYQTITLHDRLELRISKTGKGIEVTCDNPQVPAGAGNLVHRTCEAWAQARGWGGKIQVGINKTIPLGSGLGGASTDAAATILGLERLTGDRLDFPARHKLGAALGSDVPLFFFGGRVLGCGRGEEVYPLSDLGPSLAWSFPQGFLFPLQKPTVTSICG